MTIINLIFDRACERTAPGAYGVFRIEEVTLELREDGSLVETGARWIDGCNATDHNSRLRLREATGAVANPAQQRTMAPILLGRGAPAGALGHTAQLGGTIGLTPEEAAALAGQPVPALAMFGERGA